MRYKEGQKEETHKRMLQAIDHAFRQHGFNGIGVDGLAKSAGLTSGAFYKHFASKAKAFVAALRPGLQEVSSAVSDLKEEHGQDWWSKFADFYMEEKRTCLPEEACALQSLSGEVMRLDDEAKAAFEEELVKIAKSAAGTGKKYETAEVWPKLAMLVGGVTLARSVNDKKLSKLIAESIKSEIKGMAQK